DKAGDAKDASLKAPPSTEGIVLEKRLLARVKKDKSIKAQETTALEKLDKIHKKNVDELKEVLLEKLQKLLKDKESAGVTNNFGEIQIAKGSKFTAKSLSGIDYLNVNPLEWTGDDKTNNLINILLHNY